MLRLMMLTLVVLAGNVPVARGDLFVSPAGQDKNSGTAEKPVANE